MTLAHFKRPRRIARAGMLCTLVVHALLRMRHGGLVPPPGGAPNARVVEGICRQPARAGACAVRGREAQARWAHPQAAPGRGEAAAARAPHRRGGGGGGGVPHRPGRRHARADGGGCEQEGGDHARLRARAHPARAS
eukprot:2357011-Pyramimonas_sp.AAC.2